MARSATFVAVASGLAVLAAVIGLQLGGLLQGIDLALYDRYLRMAPSSDGGSSRVLVVRISERDINDYSYPVSDRTLADALDRIATAQAAVIGLDLYRDLPVPPGSAELDRLLEHDSRIIGVEKFGGAMGIPGPKPLRNSDRLGFNDLPLDADNQIRRGLLFMDDGSGAVSYSFALRTALVFLATKGIQASEDAEQPDWLRLGEQTLRPFGTDDGGYAGADDAGYQILLDCRAGGFESASLGELLRGEVGEERMRDRIVLLGQSSESVRDFAEVPCGHALGAGSLLPGVEIHAHLVDQLVRTALGASAPLRVLPDWQEIILVAALVALGGLIPSAIRPSLLFAPGVLLGWCAFVLAGYGLFRAGLWIPMAAPALGWTAALGASLASRASRERAQRAQLMQIFSSHVAPEVAEMIWSRRADFLKGGHLRAQRLMVTVLFVDMKGYTAQAEKLEPEQLLDWVNGFMEPMARKVADCGGVVDDYFGDGFKANFGVPFARQSPDEVRADAHAAVHCALAMRQSLAELNARHRARDLPPIAMRIGVHTGPVVAGILGGASKLKYTTVGDTVVIAQRLESFDQHEHDFAAEPVRVLISRATLDQLQDAFTTRQLGYFALRGKEISTEVHELLGGAS